jgi:leucyl-tRNA synthetase
MLPVQVNGKKRAELTIAAGASNAEVERAALALEPVQRFLEGRPPRKVVVVPDRIVNVVA